MELVLGKVYYIEFEKKEPLIIRLVAQDFYNLYGAATDDKGKAFDAEAVIDREGIKNIFLAHLGFLTILSVAEQEYKKTKRTSQNKMNKWLGKR